MAAMAGTKLNPDKLHFLTAYGQLGGSTLLNNSGSSVKPGIGVSPAVGVGYRLFYNEFLLQCGAEMQYAYWTNKLTDATTTLDMLDTEDQPFKMTARVHSGKDWVHNMSLVVPLLFGYEHYKFYFLLGPEFMYSFSSTTASQSLLNTSADYYGRYMDAFENMPNHQLYSGKTTSAEPQKLSLNYTILAHAEVGFRLGEVDRYKGANVYAKNYRLYLSLFADYGVLNIHTNTAKGPVVSYQETLEGLQFYVMPAMLSNEFLGAKVNPLTVGIKFTAAFELPESKTWMIYKSDATKQYQRVRGKSQAVDE